MDYDFKKMGRIIQRKRKERGLSQEVLSGLAGIGRSHLAMIESGKKNASVETLWRLSAALDVPLSSLFILFESDLS